MPSGGRGPCRPDRASCQMVPGVTGRPSSSPTRRGSRVSTAPFRPVTRSTAATSRVATRWYGQQPRRCRASWSPGGETAGDRGRNVTGRGPRGSRAWSAPASPTGPTHLRRTVACRSGHPGPKRDDRSPAANGHARRRAASSEGRRPPCVCSPSVNRHGSATGHEVTGSIGSRVAASSAGSRGAGRC